MKDLIRNYSDKPPSALKDSKVYKLLENTINSAFNETCFNINEKTFEQLQSLLGEQLTREKASKFLQPWVNAIRIAKLIEKIEMKSAKAKYRQQSRYIDTIIKNLKRGITPEEELIFFLTGNELNHELIIEYLETIKQYSLPLLELKVPNGATFNPHNIRKYGIFSLIHLGAKLGLEKKGKPSPLHQFIHIITDMEYQEINEYSPEYNKEKFEAFSTAHSVYTFIYNPEEPLIKV